MVRTPTIVFALCLVLVSTIRAEDATIEPNTRRRVETKAPAQNDTRPDKTRESALPHHDRDGGPDCRPDHVAEIDQPRVVFMIGELEYNTKLSLPKFAREQLEPRGICSTIVHADEKDRNNFPGLRALKAADLLLVSVRRRSLPLDQLALVREYAESGRPIIGIRTASHAFHTKGEHPDGHAEWQTFDREVFGGNYRDHHVGGGVTPLKAVEESAKHPILAGVSFDSFVGHGSLYRVTPLSATAMPLVVGTIPDQPPQPVAWTHRYKRSRVFYISLGHFDDFASPDFNRLLTNAVVWALNIRAENSQPRP